MQETKHGASHQAEEHQLCMRLWPYLSCHLCLQVLKEGKVTPASDVYSFAILMYELYTCKHLFKGMMHSQVRACTDVSPGELAPCIVHVLTPTCSCKARASTSCAGSTPAHADDAI